MKALIQLLVLALFWAAPVYAQDPAAPDPVRFEVATVGSGAPELFVMFGDMDVPLAAGERAERRAIAEALRQVISPGNGRVHLLIDPGPRDLSAGTFRGDFPAMFSNPATVRALATDFVEPFRRQDSRALASYLVRHIRGAEGPGIRTIVIAQPEAVDPANRPGSIKVPGPRSFEAFATYGLGAALVPGNWPPKQPEAAATELLRLLELQRVHLSVQPEGLVHLGGDLYQVDLYLSIEGLGRGRLPNNDERRLFPQDSYGLQLTATQSLQAQPVVEGSSEDKAGAPKKSAKAEIIELAFCPPYSEPFTRVSGTLERFALPQPEGLPAYVLRVILRYPEGVESVRLELDAGTWGRSQVELGQRVGEASNAAPVEPTSEGELPVSPVPEVAPASEPLPDQPKQG